MAEMNKFETILIVMCSLLIAGSIARPIEMKDEREPRQVNIRQRPDGTIVASFAAANAYDAPGVDNSFAVSQTFEIGPRGSSSSFSDSFNSNIMGNRMSSANSNAQNSRIDPFGGGFSNSAANAAANSFSNPLFSGGNSNANAFSNGFGGGLPGFGK